MTNPKPSILLIDDDPCTHDAVKMVLEPQGFDVRCFLTGPAGLAAMRERKPNLVLLDVMLATPSEGFHLAYEMKRDESLQEIPIIILSAIGQTMGLSFAKDIGTDYLPVERFLEKPFEAKTLRDAVAEVLSHAGAQS